MARLFNNRYPYTDFHELNIGWCIDKITDFEARVTDVEEDVETLKGRATALETRMTAAEGTITTHTSQIGALDGRATALENGMALVDSRVTVLEQMDIREAEMMVQPSQVTPDSDSVDVSFDTASYHNGQRSTGSAHFDIPAATASAAGVMVPGDKAKLNKFTFNGNDLQIPGDLSVVGDLVAAGGSFSGTVAAGSPAAAGDLATKGYVDSLAISGSATVDTVLNEAEHWYEGTLTNIVDYDFTTIKTYGKMVYLNFSITHTLDNAKIASTEVFGARLPKACYGSCGGPVMIWNKTDDEFIPANISFTAPISGNDFFLAGVITKKAISAGKELVVLGQFTYMSNN